ncbi:MAG: TAXI family TRAP transporter solute-binding subunit [Pseudomonadota bacterium]
MFSMAKAPKLRAAGRSWLGGVCLLGGLALTAATILPQASGVAQELKFLRIATAASGSTNYDVGGVLASAVSSPPGARPCEKGGSCGVPGLVAVVQTTMGSNENVRAVTQGQAETALVEADVAYWAYHGTGSFRDGKAARDLRAIANLFPSTVHVVVPSASGVRNIADLRGKRVALGEEGSSTAATAKTILAAYGVPLNDIGVIHAPPGAASDLLDGGKIDAFFVIAGQPSAIIDDLSRRMSLRLLPIDGTPGEELKSFYPFFSESVVQAGTYPNVAYTDSVAVSTQWITSTSADDDLVYALTAALWHESNRKLFENGHAEVRGIGLETALDRVAIPLHPGAARFYEEIGLQR